MYAWGYCCPACFDQGTRSDAVLPPPRCRAMGRIPSLCHLPFLLSGVPHGCQECLQLSNGGAENLPTFLSCSHVSLLVLGHEDEACWRGNKSARPIDTYLPHDVPDIRAKWKHCRTGRLLARTGWYRLMRGQGHGVYEPTDHTTYPGSRTSCLPCRQIGDSNCS
jgi:hypothetical protein